VARSPSQRRQRQATNLTFAKPGPGGQCVHHGAIGTTHAFDTLTAASRFYKQFEFFGTHSAAIVTPVSAHIKPLQLGVPQDLWARF
jgi:hypothetical protein